MVERYNGSPETEVKSPEELERLNHERASDLERERNNKEALERNGEKPSVEVLKENAERAAENEKEAEKTEKVAPAERKKYTPGQRKVQGEANLKKTLKQTQSHLKPGERAFSKVIHNKAVEKTSEVVGGTVARPNAILAGSLTAFLLTLAIYLIAKYFGYPLSGTETIAAFILGWVIGLLIDYLRLVITGKKA